MRCPVFGCFAEIEQPLGVEQGVGVALEPARVPGEIDQQPAQDPPRVRSGGRRGQPRPADLVKAGSLLRGEMEADVRLVGVQELPAVADRGPGREWPADVVSNTDAPFREGEGNLDRVIERQPVAEDELLDPLLRGCSVPGLAPRAFPDETTSRDEELEAVLQGTVGKIPFEFAAELPGREAVGVTADRRLDRLQLGVEPGVGHAAGHAGLPRVARIAHCEGEFAQQTADRATPCCAKSLRKGSLCATDFARAGSQPEGGEAPGAARPHGCGRAGMARGRRFPQPGQSGRPLHDGARLLQQPARALGVPGGSSNMRRSPRTCTVPSPKTSVRPRLLVTAARIARPYPRTVTRFAFPRAPTSPTR